MAAWICWSIWIARNQLVFQKRSFSLMETLHKALSDAREWKMSQTDSPQLKPLITIEPNPRQANQIAIFTDAAWNSSTGDAGFGWIVDDPVSRSHHTVSLTFVSSPLMAETMAVLAAMTFALSHGINSIAIFSDSQVLFNTINKKSMKLEIHGTLRDIYQLSVSFNSVSFNFIPRSQNVRADTMAKQALWALNPS